MRFGTFYFFQAVPWLSHDEVVHRELEQMGGPRSSASTRSG
jgi:hypothetical protein